MDCFGNKKCFPAVACGFGGRWVFWWAGEGLGDWFWGVLVGWGGDWGLVLGCFGELGVGSTGGVLGKRAASLIYVLTKRSDRLLKCTALVAICLLFFEGFIGEEWEIGST